jgi:5'-nucleotidase
VLKRLVEIGWPETVLLNVNFPALPPSKVTRVVVTNQGQRDQSMLKVDERVDARGRTYFWVGFKRIFSDPERGTDLHALAEGCISVTPLHLDLTELREQKRLSGLLDGSLATLARDSKTARPVSVGARKQRGGRFRKAAGPSRKGK